MLHTHVTSNTRITREQARIAQVAIGDDVEVHLSGGPIASRGDAAHHAEARGQAVAEGGTGLTQGASADMCSACAERTATNSVASTTPERSAGVDLGSARRELKRRGIAEKSGELELEASGWPTQNFCPQ